MFSRYDTDMFVVLMDVLLILFLTESLRAKNRGKRIGFAAAFVLAVWVYSQCWNAAVVAVIAGFTVFEDNTLSAGTDFIVGHPNWCTRVEEWQVPTHVQDLAGSGTYIGASAVQGRKVYAHKVTKGQTVFVKKTVLADA